MFETLFLDRVEKLLAVRVAERRKQFPFELLQIDNNANARGMLHSSVRLFQIHHAHEHELEVRAILAWESAVRVHRTLGSSGSDSLRPDLKSLLRDQLEHIHAELRDSFLERARQTEQSVTLTLEDTLHHVLAKHEIEIDLYVDSFLASMLETPSTKPMAQNYTFYGNIGAVQTGPNSVANVVQNLGAEDRSSLISALAQVEEALRSMPQLVEQQRKELLEIAAECRTQVNSSSPNNTKLLTLFNVLGTSVQAIASAQPAYQALKVALLPLGINLP